ncbi:MAG: DUF2946 family protein [Pseudolabrys sp.]
MREMRQGLVALVAIFAITLHGLLATLAPVSAAASGFDPLAITCLTGGHGATPQNGNQDGSTPAPTHNCDHCVLCLATALPTPAVASTAWAPASAGVVTQPPVTRLAVTSEARPHFPRGPPQAG